MKVLHLLTWYPTQADPLSGVWIERHVEALSEHVEHQVARMPVFSGPWRLRELKALWWMRSVTKNSDADVINVHIAYPMLVHAHWLPGHVKRRIAITEHWSYYRFHFYSSRKLTRVKRLFHRGWPVLAVSHQLLQDMQGFSGAELNGHVVPNVVDTSVFVPLKERQKRLVMGSFWKHPKQPLLAIAEIDNWLAQHPDWSLEIFGYGPQTQAILEALKSTKCAQRMHWNGQLSSQQIAALVGGSRGFVHASEYETFSVVCAEAQCCGTPVAYTPNGAIPEVVVDGVALPEQHWGAALDALANTPWSYDSIAQNAQGRFAMGAVGKRYFQALQACFPSTTSTS